MEANTSQMKRDTNSENLKKRKDFGRILTLSRIFLRSLHKKLHFRVFRESSGRVATNFESWVMLDTDS